MILEKIIDNIIDEIEKAYTFTKEELRSCLEVCNIKGKPNCTFFLLKIRQNAAEITNDFYTSILNANIKYVKDVTARGPSVSFNINIIPYGSEIISTILEKNESFGKNNIGNNKTVVIDYSSPNIAKIFHMGHFRTTILGNFIKKLHNFCGYNAIGLNYLGDWGKQFGFVLLGYEKFGKEEELKNDPIKHLFDVYVKINNLASEDPTIDTQAKKIFEMMEKDNNEKYLKQWAFFRQISINKYKELYKKLGVEFEEYSGESKYEKICWDEIKKLDFLITNPDKSVCVDLGKEKNPVVLKSDGTTLYLTRDYSAALDRIKRHKAEKLIYVVSVEQKEHFEDLFSVLKKAKVNCEFEHVQYGMVKGMSTRKGTVKFLEDIIETATDVMLKQIESEPERRAAIEDVKETALNLAVSTLIIMDFSAKRIKGYEFDVEKRAKNVNGTGSYIQYAHCRLKSIEIMNKDLDIKKEIDTKFIEQEEIQALLYKLIWFEKTIVSCLEDLEPNKLYTYINDLCAYTNSINKKMMVKGVDSDIASVRLNVLKCARIVIGNALRLFGLTPLNKM
ncbi:arginine-tRNA ligase (RARS1) [Vairimorpha necatrix]|uniref:arginine--tRNA ligase n=1 Tax=Vairimorpha necatrix TaxID=6039 RepID=A0AAX4JDL5_9MICR